MCSALSSKISLLRQLATYVPTEVLKKFYQSYILPLIDYGSITWSCISAANLDRILKLQKRAARFTLHTDFSTSSAAMFQDLGWQPITKRLAYNKAVMTYKAIHNQIPQYITNLLKPISETHSRSLRSSVNGTLAVHRSRTSFCDKSFSISTPRLWNSLPSSVRNETFLDSFKKGLKEVLQMNN